MTSTTAHLRTQLGRYPALRTLRRTVTPAQVPRRPYVPNYVRALFLRDQRLCVLWSAKSSCTFVVKWAFNHLDLIDEAKSHAGWVHSYRHRVYETTRGYRFDLSRIVDADWTFVKVVRNPYDRAVSSFIHAHRHGYEDAAMSAFLGRDVAEDRYSFRDFVAYLDSINLAVCNIHHGLQHTQLEDLRMVRLSRVIQIESGLEDRLHELERDFGLPMTDFEHDRFRSGHHSVRIDDRTPAMGFAKIDPLAAPPVEAFYDDHLRHQIGRLYRRDFVAYGYQL